MPTYSLKSFLRNVPNLLLKSYLDRHGLLSDFQWELSQHGQTRPLGETEISELAERIQGLSLLNLGKLEQDFRDMTSMADDNGVLCLIDQASSPIHRVNLAQAFSDNHIEGHYARVMWVWLHHHQIFEFAFINQHLDRMSGWKDCEVGTGLPCGSDPETLALLADAISEHLKTQAKGKHCLVEYYHRQVPERHCFFAYPEDSAKPEMQYNENGQLIRSARRPVFEVVFMYEPESGMLRVHARGAKTAKYMQELFCQNILGLDGIPDENTRVYDLTKLKDSAFRFQTEPVVERIKLKTITVDLPDREQVILKIEPRAGQEMKLRERIATLAIAYGITVGQIFIKRAKMQAVFKSEDGKKPKTVTFEIGLPDYSTLEDSYHHNIIKRHIDRWGFRRKLLVGAEVA